MRLLHHLAFLYPRVSNVTRLQHAYLHLPAVPLHWGGACHSLRLRDTLEVGRRVAVRRFEAGPYEARHALWELVGVTVVQQRQQAAGAGGASLTVNSTETVVRVTPLHPSGHGPSWEVSLINVSNSEWDPAQGPLRRASFGSVDATDPKTTREARGFEGLMAEAASLFRLGWPAERGDDAHLADHVGLGTYGVERDRTPYEVIMDTRAFNRLLSLTAKAAAAGDAGFMDARRVIDR